MLAHKQYEQSHLSVELPHDASQAISMTLPLPEKTHVSDDKDYLPTGGPGGAGRIKGTKYLRFQIFIGTWPGYVWIMILFS